jgi:deazaflavin-dependent oxidoreductase (nitroreductase family)
MLAESEEKQSWFVDQLRHFNKRITNPIMMSFAGKRVYAVVNHTGRRSGYAYRTPVLAVSSNGGFYIPLPYGPETDWCRNVRSAGSCTIEWHGERFPVTKPQLVDPQRALLSLPGWLPRIFRQLKTCLYLYVEIDSQL